MFYKTLRKNFQCETQQKNVSLILTRDKTKPIQNMRSFRGVAHISQSKNVKDRNKRALLYKKTCLPARLAWCCIS